MNVVLQQITNILCNYYPPHHQSMYPIRQMGIKGERIHFSERKKIMTYEHKKELCHLLEKLMNVKLNPDDCRTMYYRSCVYDKLLMVINGLV